MRRLALAAAALSVAGLLSGPTAATAGQPAQYCPGRDAYEMTACRARPHLPAGPVSDQLSWVRRQLAGDAATLTEGEVRRHFTAGMLAGFQTSAPELVAALQATVDRFGPLHLIGFSYPPRSRQALTIFATANSSRRLEVPISVARRSGRINSLAVTRANPVIVPRGRFSGWYDIGGRQLFLHCSGRGHPTVVFENGLTTDWYQLEHLVASTTRACSYDPARQGGPLSRSDSASAPRTGNDRVRDLHALLRVAGVPGPYVLAGHSNGGLFSLIYASRHPRTVAGLVLIDGVHPAYHRRTFNALKHLIPQQDWPEAHRQYCAVPSLQQDWEQLDICRAERQARTQLSAHPLQPMPLAVLSHGIPEGAPGPERDIGERVWAQLQRELAALAPGSEHLIARHSPHDIQHTQPRLVLTELRKVLAAVRHGRTTLVPGSSSSSPRDLAAALPQS